MKNPILMGGVTQCYVSRYVEENKEELRGEPGPQGPKGDDGNVAELEKLYKKINNFLSVPMFKFRKNDILFPSKIDIGCTETISIPSQSLFEGSSISDPNIVWYKTFLCLITGSNLPSKYISSIIPVNNVTTCDDGAWVHYSFKNIGTENFVNNNGYKFYECIIYIKDY